MLMCSQSMFAVAGGDYVDESGLYEMATFDSLQRHKAAFLKMIAQGTSFPLLKDFSAVNGSTNVKEGYIYLNNCSSNENFICIIDDNGQWVGHSYRKCTGASVVMAKGVYPSERNPAPTETTPMDYTKCNRVGDKSAPFVFIRNS